jgi:hypothetical protein
MERWSLSMSSFLTSSEASFLISMMKSLWAKRMLLKRYTALVFSTLLLTKLKSFLNPMKKCESKNPLIGSRSSKISWLRRFS